VFFPVYSSLKKRSGRAGWFWGSGVRGFGRFGVLGCRPFGPLGRSEFPSVQSRTRTPDRGERSDNRGPPRSRQDARTPERPNFPRTEPPGPPDLELQRGLQRPFHAFSKRNLGIWTEL